jgi:DNA ligase-1
MFPELQDIFSTLNVASCVLDAEAIGYNKETGQLLAFQETMTRRRKHNIGAKAIEVPIRFYVFDVLKVDDNELLSEKMQDRKDVLKSLFAKNEVLLETPYIVTSSAEETRKKHIQYLAEGLEGAVMKQVDSQYVSGRKGWNWVKIKEAEGTTGKLTDTLDVIVMGYYTGRGKRSQFGIGALLTGVLNNENNQVVTIGKIGTGLTEEQLVVVKKLCDENAVSEMPKQYSVPKTLLPDVWISPSVVVEVAADELTKSPNHTAKVATRFPRMVQIRNDKSWEQATTLQEVASISIAK